jgi:hypothetical protein
MGTCLDIGRRLHVSLWIVLGYREQAMEFLARKSRLAIPGIVLLSDGAYGEWLRDIQISDLYLSFPRVRPKDSPTTIPDRSRQLRGYASYGFDAYLIILKALDEAIARNGDKTTFKALLSESSLAPNLVPLAGSYDFAASGENNAATFTIVEVGNGNLP